ncbi:MAG: formate/nitrite transporter family protein [Ilumatobacteraceae bacterium]
MDQPSAPQREPGEEDEGRAEREIERDPDAENVPGAFERAIDEGLARSERSWPSLCATGLVGGLDVGVGVLALLVVRAQTGSELLGALAFPVGFLALTLGNSELFTENFLVPVAALVAKRVTFVQLIRLWIITLAANLAGGWIVAWLIANALPDVHSAATDAAASYHVAGIGAASFASAVLGGMVITLLTWLQHSTNSVPAKVFAAYAFAFVLAAPPLAHSIVGSLEQFVALVQGAPFGYADWLGFLGWVVLGNTLGGVGLVTALRLVQVGRSKIESEQPTAAT